MMKSLVLSRIGARASLIVAVSMVGLSCDASLHPVNPNDLREAPQAAVAEGFTSFTGATSNAVVVAPTIFWYSGAGTATMWKMNGTVYTGESLAKSTLATPWRVAAVADMNANGSQDLIAENVNDGSK